MTVLRWLLLLLPAVPVLVLPFISEAWLRAYDIEIRGEGSLILLLGEFLISFAIAAVLSAILGAQMEKWKRGAVESIPRVIVYALNILFTACFVGWGGWALVNKYFAP